MGEDGKQLPGQAELEEEASSGGGWRHRPATLPSRPARPPPFPPDAISALIKISSSDSRGTANKGSRNSNYLLEAVPGAVEVSYGEKQVAVAWQEGGEGDPSLCVRERPRQGARISE